MHFYVGTSGYGFMEWKGNFYPEKLPPKNVELLGQTVFDRYAMEDSLFRVSGPAWYNFRHGRYGSLESCRHSDVRRPVSLRLCVRDGSLRQHVSYGR